MRHDDALFLDMLLAARKIQTFVAGMSEEEFKAHEMAKSAVIREFQVIGEAARIITEASKEEHSSVEWKMIAGMRNRLIHEYFAIRYEVVWQTIHTDLPPLISELEKILPKEDES